MPKQRFVLFDGNEWESLLPITATRSVADIRIGILTIKEKWEKYLIEKVDILSQDYLNVKYTFSKAENAVFLNSAILPNPTLIQEINNLEKNTILQKEGKIIAISVAKNTINNLSDLWTCIKTLNAQKEAKANFIPLNFPWDIFTHNGKEIVNDIQLLGLKPNPEKLSSTNILIGNNIYIEEGAQCECAILNSTNGPIYLGKDSEVMEGCTIRGPFALCEHAALKMQAKIYGDTTIGPHSKVGGEVSNAVLIGYSNKGHDGFLGNAVLGEWCNLGADTNNSNLRNNYGKVQAYHYPSKKYINTELQFCGLIMGDHAKTAINTQFNTGTVVGVCANVFDAGFPPKFIPDFSWGNNATFELEKAYEVAQRVMKRRGIELSEADKQIFKNIFEQK